MEIFEEEEKTLNEAIEEANKNDIGETGLSELKQGSKEWFKMRLGLFTGSKFPRLMTQGRGKDAEWGDTSYKLIKEIFIERDLTETGIELYVDEQFNKEFRQTKWGNKYESFARDAYTVETGELVEETCFEVHPIYDFIGGSFDGKVIKKSKIIEIKCPYDPVVHSDNFELIDTGIPQNHTYYPQIQMNIEIAGVDSCDFVSFDIRRKRDKLAIINVPRDQVFIDKILARTFIANRAIHYMNMGIDVAGSILLAQNELQS